MVVADSRSRKVNKIAYDDNSIAKIDEEMGWIEEDGSSPSKTARDLGMHVKFLDGHTAWVNPSGLWSLCILPHSSYSDLQTTLLAKSYLALRKLYRKMQKRKNDPKRWQSYYSLLWEKRYRKWVHGKKQPCDCQLCRIKGVWPIEGE